MDINKFWKEIGNFKKAKVSKENLLEKDGFKLLKTANQNYSNLSTVGMDIDEIFEHLKERSIQEILIEDGFKCLNNLYSDNLAYDFEGDFTLKINNDFMSLDNDLSGLAELKVNIEDKKISLDNLSYNLKTVQHIFGGIGDFDKPATGMMYLQMVNDHLAGKGIKKIAYLITDTKNNEMSGLFISNSIHFQKIQHIFNYIEHLNETNREKVIQIAKGEIFDMRALEILTNYKGVLIQKGPVIHVVE